MALSFKNIIFDLGGVILDLSVSHSVNAFAKHTHLSPAQVQAVFEKNPLLNNYEKGLVTDKQFREDIRALFHIGLNDDELDSCWNAMLRGIPLEKLNLLQRLQSTYHTFLLSNTNGIHLNYIETRLLPPWGLSSLDPCFQRTYYSHRLLKRKPEPEIFEQVLEENGLNPNETLFLDDHPDNIAAASAVGIQSVQVTNHDFILSFFHDQRT